MNELVQLHPNIVAAVLYLLFAAGVYWTVRLTLPLSGEEDDDSEVCYGNETKRSKTSGRRAGQPSQTARRIQTVPTRIGRITHHQIPTTRTNAELTGDLPWHYKIGREAKT